VTTGAILRTAGAEALRVLLDAAHSDGALGVVEMAFAARGAGPPLHVHPTHGEGFYVLAGEMTFQLGDEIVTAAPGTWAFAPRDTPHTLANRSARPARLLCIFAPGGFERRFARMLVEATGTDPGLALSTAEEASRMIGPPLSVPDDPADL
jgi:quercetin dioxygenase-like cupin family protein